MPPEASIETATYHRVAALVLGGTGFIGRWVARWLTLGGATVHLAVRNRTTAERLCGEYDIRATIHEIDLTAVGAAAALVRKLRPDVIFNLAGYGVDRHERDEALAYRINDALVAELADAAAAARNPAWKGTSLIHVGSALEYGESGGDLAESTEPHPTTLYGQSKLAGTRRLSEAAQRLNLPAVTARLFTVYGPGEHEGRLLPTLLEAASHRDPIPLTAGTQLRDFTFVEDVAEGLLRLGGARCAPGEVVNLATGRLTSVREFVENAAWILGIDALRLRFGALPQRGEEMNHAPVSVDRLKSCVGWVPAISMQEGISRSRDWGREPSAPAACSDLP